MNDDLDSQFGPPIPPTSGPSEPMSSGTSGASKGPSATKAPMTAKTASKAASVSSGVGNFVSRVFNFAPVLTPEEKQVRGELLKINNQLILTRKLIESNEADLRELAKTDKSVAEILKTLKSDEFRQIEAIQKQILDGKDVSKKNTKRLIDSLHGVTKKLDDSKVSLEVKFSDIATHFEKLITNNDVDREDRRQMIEELVKIGSASEIQNQLTENQKLHLKQLEAMSKTNLNFTKEQNTELKNILLELSDSSVDKAKLRGTLNELNQSIDAAVLTNADLEKMLKEKTDSGKTVEESALKEGIHGVAKTGLAGLVDYALSGLGLGGLGLGDTLAEGAVPLLGKGLGKAAGFAGKYAGGILGDLGGLISGGMAGTLGAGGLLKGGAKVLGKVALPITALMGAYDFYKGYNNANEIAGLKPGEKAGFGTKFQAGASSALSGLSFGLVDPQTVYKGIDKGIDFLFGKEGILGETKSWFERIWKITPLGMISNLLGTIGKSILNFFGEDGLFSKIENFFAQMSPTEWISKIQSVFTTITDFMFGEDGIFTLKTVQKALGAAASAVPGGAYIMEKLGFSTQTQVAGAESKPAQVPTKASDYAIEDTKMQRDNQQKMLTAAQTKPAPIIIPSQNDRKTSIDRSPGIDDLTLGMMNAGMAGI